MNTALALPFPKRQIPVQVRVGSPHLFYNLAEAHLFTGFHSISQSFTRFLGEDWGKVSHLKMRAFPASSSALLSIIPNNRRFLADFSRAIRPTSHISNQHHDFTGGWNSMARFNGGWIKIHRKAILGDIGANFLRSGLFTTLIAIANLKASTVSWKGRPRKLERGEIVTSFQELAELGECDRKSVMRHLKYLSERETIIVEKSFGGLFVKILNFDKYQTVDAEGSQVSPISLDGGMDSDVPSERTHIEEGKNKRKKELKKANPDFEKAFDLYPIHQKGPNAEIRFAEQIKKPEDLADLLRALENYKANLAKNPWRHPKGNFATFLGTERSGFFWRDWINSDALEAQASEQSEFEKWAKEKRASLEGKAG